MNGNYKGTEHYTLTKTENGWHGDPECCGWQWFDFPDLTFTDDGDCRFELEPKPSTRRPNSTNTGNFSPSFQ